jgi:hypothetical protein
MDIKRNIQEEYFRSRRWSQLNRCNGILLRLEVKDIESINAPNESLPEKTVYEYYDNALSDPAVNKDPDLIAYSNPARGELNISSLNSLGRSDIVLVNAMGQEVYTEYRDLNNYFSINTYDLPSGIYTLRISNELIQISEKITIVK